VRYGRTGESHVQEVRRQNGEARLLRAVRAAEGEEMSAMLPGSIDVRFKRFRAVAIFCVSLAVCALGRALNEELLIFGGFGATLAAWAMATCIVPLPEGKRLFGRRLV